MAINGRINVDVLFHDTDGTTSLKVVSLDDSTEYTTGKVAIVTGTVGTAVSGIAVSPSAYKDASGNAVTFATLERFAFSATGTKCRCQNDWATVQSTGGEASVCELKKLPDDFYVYAVGTAGTASYTLVVYGT